MRRWAIITLGLILTIALVILVWNKETTIYPYVFIAIILSIISMKDFSELAHHFAR